MSDLTDRIRKAVQAAIDAEEHEGSQGWTVTQYVVVMGLERIHDAKIESCGWIWAPPDQADWMTIGLLEAGLEMRADSVEE
jgi:hypothetical protein